MVQVGTQLAPGGGFFSLVPGLDCKSSHLLSPFSSAVGSVLSVLLNVQFIIRLNNIKAPNKIAADDILFFYFLF